MPELDLMMTYTFDYLINEESETDRKKRLLRDKTCSQIHLEKLFNNLPSWFSQNLAGTRDYFKLVLGKSDPIPDTPGYDIAGDAANEEAEKYVTKSIFSCVAEHLCSVVYPKTAKVEIFQGDDLNYGIDVNVGYAKNMLQIATASEEWLDFWASHFVSPGRRNSEGDETLRDRVLSSLNQPKNTIDVIKKTINNYLGYEPVIYELVETGIHNNPISPWAPPEVNNDFAHNSVKDIKRRACRLVIELKAVEPFDGAAYTRDTNNPLDPMIPPTPPSPLEKEEWFVREPSRVGDPMIAGAARQRDEAYIFDPMAQVGGGLTLEQLASIVRGVKAAGVKIYYKFGATGASYAII